MEHDPQLTAAYLAGKVDEYVKQAARDTIALNSSRDANARYARIPDGGACDFCEMLGSRGFVYRSEESAGAAWHPFCNCQLAVAFDPFIEKTEHLWTTVTRGYADDYRLVRTGAGGSRALRDADIDELYERCRAAGRDYSKKSRYRDHARGARLTDEEFDAAMKRLSDARTLDELHAVGDEIARDWTGRPGGPDKRQWSEMSRHAKELEKRFREEGLQAHREAMVDSKWFEDAQTRAVHWDKVDSKDYTAKMAEVVGDKDMARIIHDDVKAILKKTDKTPFEELYAYDLTAGERIERVIDQRKPLEVVPTKKLKAKVQERIDAGHRVVTLHNHSGSNIPSLADIHGLKARGDEFGIVACHNGEVFTYRIVGDPAEGYIIDSSEEAGKKFLGSFMDRMIKKGFDAALQDVGDLYGVKFERFL